VVEGGSIVAAYVVNPPAGESVLRAAGTDRIARALPEWNVAFADDADGWGRRIFEQRLGYELWRTILVVLLILLLIEGIAAATGSVRAAPASAQET
jgi:hypothetical protein